MNHEARIAELEAKVEALSKLLDNASRSAAVPAADESTSRRGLLKLAGATAVGVVAASVAGVGQAAADDSLAIEPGVTNSTANPTKVRYTGTDNTITAFVFDADNYAGNGSFYPAALAGWTGNATDKPASGVYGYTINPAGYGVVAYNNGGGTGALALGSNHAVEARGSSGYGVAVTQSGTASLFLRTANDGGPKTAPGSRSDAHVVGEIDTDSNGDLWYCTVSGTPGTWRKLSGPAVAGAFHAVSPSRVYDSRSAAPLPGKLGGGANRLVSVADKRNLSTGAVVTANIVPAGATAISVNVTVTATVGSGFLSINEGGNTTVAASAINWFAADQTFANGIIVPINASRQVTVIAGGGSTDFVLDVTGYYL